MYNEMTKIKTPKIITEKWVTNHINGVNLDYIVSTMELSEKFLRKYIDRLNMEIVCRSQKLSIKFMDDFHDLLCWDSIY